MTLLVGVVEDDPPSRDVLGSRPGVHYRFIEPWSQPPADAVDVDALLIWNVRNGYVREHWSRFTRLRWVHAGLAGVERVLFP